jgi:GNAT superfamily N-acetyltransferase
MLQIRDITIGGLSEFIESEEFRQMEHIPISPQRALSHSKNPNASADDKILFLIYDDGRFIGYLGALPDVFHLALESHKVAWLSCMWVDPEWRRHGIAHKLLMHANDAWESNLLISNFIPKSKAVFDKTGLFEHFKNLEGIRGYIRFNIAEILVAKKPVLQKVSGILKLTDSGLNIFNEFRLYFWKRTGNILHPEFLTGFDAETEKFLLGHNQQHITLKSTIDFRWIKEYPWVIESSKPDRDSLRYDFSSSDKRFRQHFLILSNANGSPVAFLMLSLRGNHLKTPFAYIENGYEKDILRFLYAYMTRQGIRTFTTYHPALVSHVKGGRHPFILTRRLDMESIITPRLKEKLGNTDHYYLQDGDGDGAFT